MIEWATMVDIKSTVSVVVALMVGALAGGLVGHFAVPSRGQRSTSYPPSEAQCVLQGATASSSVRGTLALERSQNVIQITGIVSGLPVGHHGFHVHTVGSLLEGCRAAKGHFNPFKMPHGAPTAASRHVGDLGNVAADASRMAIVNITDETVAFSGAANILGRSLVVHTGKDDFGSGGNSSSLETGNAGVALACCIIGVVR